MCHFSDPFSPGNSFGGAYIAQTLEDVFTVVNPRDLGDSQDQTFYKKNNTRDTKIRGGIFLNRYTSCSQGRSVCEMEWA